MDNEAWLRLLQQERAIAVIRASQMSLGIQMALAVASGGMRLIEITWNSDRAAETICYLRSHLPDCVIGVGTLLNINDLEEALAAGAEFLFSPHTDEKMIKMAINAAVPIVPGALSPTEIVTAWGAGAAAVKVFPVSAVGGASYIKSLQGPLGHIPLIPTGGVTLENAAKFIAAGAIAVGLAGELFPKTLVATGNWQAVAQRSQSLKTALLVYGKN
ncbi:bifunctional 4-hydroxy-2-oxoglutarate aldolase/2-dehydro-3-deoxy-phosphogluconate aldolase [Ancylothrix sp. C2]|uniref:bifunctional 4-hydroxy-2-oxoglutarate aldolase/2-dehydro-3-deoxy-phosphogluconate aldolase n=1 Tax=Ancylothrix sp. D3o TaxID=2953691 RepID=UPI0021BA3F64|nr:bifunctional 4-hydroxy-2-oxoglutarate aldolase/2-dehydro-3-deoxy-phosphogluconate aldolase [Ancylothrix sp. D3o]MCT7951114.1 bifunctional 4-hydroxy-2-oxoglutarate aldolase/2-dehydro-3-deoxy-phosphogluconate aldolase [Ancylothrix sp. D3o]